MSSTFEFDLKLCLELKHGVSFPFLRQFEWHDHLYESIKSKVTVTDQMRREDFHVETEFHGISIILCILASLSSPTLDKGPRSLLVLRPPCLLSVDEASQVLLNNYPHLFSRFFSTLDRVISIGDDRQLAPFGSEQMKEARSVFDVPEPRKKALFFVHEHKLSTPKRPRSFHQ